MFPTYYGDRVERRLMESVRARLPDEFWERAAETMSASDSPGVPIGPLGDGVVFFADGRDIEIPMEVRAEIAWEAAEAAREVIESMLDEYERRVAPIAWALAQFDRSL